MTPTTNNDQGGGQVDTTPDDCPIISGRSAIDSFMGTKRTIVSVGDVRHARALVTPTSHPAPTP
jgi:hypothetical protein